MRADFLGALRRLGGASQSLERVLDCAPFAVLINHSEDGCIYASAEALRVFEMEWDAFKGFGWMSAVIPADAETLRGTFERYQQDMKETDVRYRISMPDGSTRAIVATASPVLDASGAQVGSVVVGRLATDEYEDSERRVKAQKLEVIGRLAGRVAHDFNNVLTPIACSAVMLEDEALSSDGRESVATILQSVQHASAITRQLLGLSRQGEHTPRVAHIDHEIESMRSMLGQVLGERIELTLDLQSGGAQVGLAAHELGQVLLNLCVNSRDAINGIGRVGVTTRRDGSFVELGVLDSGDGIPPEVQARMFDPFFTTKAPDRGTGLGLATARDLVRRAGGDIQLDTSAVSGTHMVVKLPSQASQGTQAPTVGPSLDLPPQRILLVDDNSALRQTLAYVLALRNHDVKTSATFARASEMMRQEVFDVLITDILLPDGRGNDLALLAAEALPNAGIVYITGFAGEDFEMSVREETRAVFLQKPFHPNDVLKAMEQVLRAQDVPG